MSGARIGVHRELSPRRLPPKDLAGAVGAFRVHVGKKIYGPVKFKDLRRIPGFTLQTPVAPYGSNEWKPAYKIVDLKKYFNYTAENSFTKKGSANNIQALIASGALDSFSPPVRKFRKYRRDGKIVSKILLSLLVIASLSGGAGTWKVLKPAEKENIARQCVEVGRSLQYGVSTVLERALSALEP